MDTIMQRCNVSSRTAYRYITDLSEAHLPVYYDEEARGYRLSTNSQPLPTHLSPDEFILIRIAAEMFSRKLTGPYAKALADIIGKLEATYSSSLSDLWQEGKGLFWSNSEDQELDAFTNSLMLQAAIAMDKDVSLVVNGAEPEGKIYVRRPSLSFEDGWAVCSREVTDMSPIPLSEIKQVVLEPERPS